MSPIDRRTFLKGAGALGLASLVTPIMPGAAATFLKGRNPIQHVIVDLQENRSFDHYYGFAPFAGKAGVPAGYTQPDGYGGTIAPYHFTSLTTPDIGHGRNATHAGHDSVPFGNTDNVFFFWKRFAHDMRAHANKQDFFTDLNQGTLPNVSWIIPSFARGWDEHPPADISVGMGIVQELVDGLRNSSSWASSAYIHTYDEAGGYFDHVRPPQVDAFGLGIRVPTWVISPFAKPAHLEPTVYEHTSTLKFIEAVYSLPTLAAANHLFDSGTPSGGNYEAATGSVGPPAPPRDANPSIGNLMECFAF